MRYVSTPIDGLFIIEAKKFVDLRGELIKPFNYKSFELLRSNIFFKELWFTKSQKNVIRAMHMQVGDKPAEKLVSVINGRVIDVVLDMRIKSITYGEYFEIELSDKEPKAVYIPIGCAHGYRVLEDNTITMYMSTKEHSAQNDTGVRWDSFGYDWKISNPILSDRDKNLPKFKVMK